MRSDGRRPWRRRGHWRQLGRILAVVLAAIPMVARAEVVVGGPPANLTLDGDPSEWADRPAALSLLPRTPAGRSGRVWVAQSAEGLLIAARITGGPTVSIANPLADAMAADRIDLWLALIDDMALPKIGWGNQLGPVTLESADDCAKIEEIADDGNAIAECRNWVKEQQAYRRQFRKLFARQWRLAAGPVTETFAAPALGQLSAEARAQISQLAPSTAAANLPTARFAPMAEGGYGLEIAVPWSALPPAATLDLTRLRLMLDISPAAAGAAPLASTAPDGKPGDVATFNLLHLDPVRHWRISECGFPLTADDQWGEQTLPAYFLPKSGEQISDIFVIENNATADQSTPGGYSPVITPTRLFSLRVTPDITLCGPTLAVRRGARSRFVDDLTLSPGARVKPVNGGWLVAQGPFVGDANRFGTGACGACPTISLQALFLPEAEAPPSIAFSDAWLIEDEDVKTGTGRNARVTISDDLTTITAWEGEAPDDQPKLVWTRVRKCYDATRHVFADCGRDENVKPPVDIPMPPDEPEP